MNNNNNNNNNNLNVILIRGNHENETLYESYGFKEEIKLKTSGINSIFKNFFTYCPSAIILNNNKTKYWLCHGGFEISNDYKSYYNFSNNKKIVIHNLFEDIRFADKSQIRWNDFSGNNNTRSSIRNEYSNIYKNIGNKDLYKFLNELEIDFIIRGHNDDYSNAMLLKDHNMQISRNKNDADIFFFLNDVKNKNIINNGSSLKKNIIKYKEPFNTKKKCLNEILTIYPKNFEKKSFTINSDIKLLPVLTISNNSDLDRTQYSDSYIIISNDKDFIK